MALLFCDGFDSYDSAAELPLRWTSAANTSFAPTLGKFGGGRIQLPQNVAQYQIMPTAFGGVGNKIGLACWFMSPHSAGAAPYGILSFGAVATLTIDSQTAGLGTCTVKDLKGTTQGTFSGVTLNDGNFHWIEINIDIETAATGAVNVYVDGVSVLSVTGIATCTSGADTLTKFGIASVNTTYGAGFFDDIVLWDSTGSSFNSFPLGPKRISTLKPNAAGDSTGFTPSTGNNYAAVAGNYTATTFVSDALTHAEDLYNMSDLPITPASVDAVVPYYYGQNSGGNTAALIPAMKTGGTTVTQTALPLQLLTSTVKTGLPWYADAGGTAWTGTSVNGMQMGMTD